MFLSGSIGDVIALYSFMEQVPKSIILASPASGAIAELCYHLGIECKVIEAHRTYHTKFECESIHGKLPGDDWSISKIFPEIVEGKHIYRRSIFDSLKLPRKIAEIYTLVSPASVNYVEGRNLTSEELNFIMANTTGKIVVLNKGWFPVAKHPRVIDMSNLTNMMEGLALVKHCSAFYGIDSWPAVAVCQVPNIPIHIKSGNPGYYHYLKCWTSPRTDSIKVSPSLG